MSAIFLDALRRMRGQILGWGIALALLGALVIPLFDTVAANSAELAAMLESYPAGFLAAFGMDDIASFSSPAGYLHAEFFSYMPLILGIFALLAGSGALASDEEQGTLDLLLAHPISRRALFVGRVGAFGVALALVLLLAWLGMGLAAASSNFPESILRLVGPFLSLFGVTFFFGTLALALSMVLPSRRVAATVAGLGLVLAFFAQVLAGLSPRYSDLEPLSPLHYYQGGYALEGLRGDWLAGLIGVGLLLVLFAAWRFQRRDVRVAGEGGWRWPLPGRRRRPA